METVYIDGTFSFCTRFFAQLFTVHRVQNGNYVQLAFDLLPAKTEETYKKVFELLLDVCPLFAPSTVFVDFEQAIHSAVRSTWPGVIVIGCRFHLRQAWYRQVQKLGLQCEYQQKTSDIAHWLRHVFRLTFLEPTEVYDAFVNYLIPT